MRTILFYLVLAISSASLAHAEREVGNGGSGIALEFTTLGNVLYKGLNSLSSENRTQFPTGFELGKLKLAVESTKVVAMETPLLDNQGHPATAVFIKDKNLIFVNMSRWRSETHDNPVIASALAFHEYLRAAGVSDDQYRTFNKFFSEKYFRGILAQNAEIKDSLASFYRSNSRWQCVLSIRTTNGALHQYRGIGPYVSDARYDAFVKGILDFPVIKNDPYFRWSTQSLPYSCQDRDPADPTESWPALLVAAKNNDEGEIKKLLASGAGINVVNGDKDAALMIAIRENSEDAAIELLKHSTEINFRKQNNKGNTALIEAVLRSNVYLAQKLVGTGQDLGVNLASKENGTALSLAARRGASDMINVLAKIPGIDLELQKPLRCAVYNGHIKATQALIDAGADIRDAYDVPGQAARRVQHSLLTMVLGSPTSTGSSKEMIKLLLDAGLSPEGLGTERWTPLMEASIRNRLEEAQVLLDKGASINAQSNTNEPDFSQQTMGYSALMLAVDLGWIEMVKLLLEAGADVNLVNLKGETALTIARNNLSNLVRADVRKPILDLITSAGGHE